MKKKIFTALGLMSGTSMDGVDLSLIKTDGHDYYTQIYDKYYDSIPEKLPAEVKPQKFSERSALRLNLLNLKAGKYDSKLLSKREKEMKRDERSVKVKGVDPVWVLRRQRTERKLMMKLKDGARILIKMVIQLLTIP